MRKAVLKTGAALLLVLLLLLACASGAAVFPAGGDAYAAESGGSAAEGEAAERVALSCARVSAADLAAYVSSGAEKEILAAYTVTASIAPETAYNREVDFSVAWQDAPEYGEEDVTDFVEVLQEEDGALTAVVAAYRAFGGDTVLLTVTTRDGGYTAECLVCYEGKAETLEACPETLSPVSSDERGEYYLLMTGGAETFVLETDNVFHAVRSQSLEVASVSAEGYFYRTAMEPEIGTSLAGTVTYTHTREALADYADLFLSASVSGDTLTVTAGGTALSEYRETEDGIVYSYAGSSYDYSPDSAEYAALNETETASCCFVVTVEDTVSGTRCEIRIWTESSVTDVSLSVSLITF